MNYPQRVITVGGREGGEREKGGGLICPTAKGGRSGALSPSACQLGIPVQQQRPPVPGREGGRGPLLSFCRIFLPSPPRRSLFVY